MGSRLFLCTAAALALMLEAGLGTAQPAGATSQDELLFWETIKGSSDPADFQEYLKQYPNGRFAGLARIRLRGITPGAPAAAPSRGTTARAAPPPGPAAPASLLPQKGDAWTYRFIDRKYGRKEAKFSVRVDDIAENVLTETLNAEGGAKIDLRRIDLRQLRFTSSSLPAGRTLLEFAPYATTLDAMSTVPYRISFNSGYPIGGANQGDWKVTVTRVAAAVTVPAGTFKAQYLVLKGVRNPPYVLNAARFQVGAWYAPEAKRYVRIEHKEWNNASSLLADEIVELLEFTPR